MFLQLGFSARLPVPNATLFYVKKRLLFACHSLLELLYSNVHDASLLCSQLDEYLHEIGRRGNRDGES
jgi:hypothetical protein